MTLYCFYPCAPNGLASTFETAEFETDAEAAVHAQRVLDDHLSAASVVVWCGNRTAESNCRRVRAGGFSAIANKTRGPRSSATVSG